MVALARSADPLESLVKEITSAGGTAEFKVCDISSDGALGEAVEEISTKHGRLDVLVNNAGITRDGLILRMSDEDFDDVINVMILLLRRQGNVSFSNILFLVQPKN